MYLDPMECSAKLVGFAVGDERLFGARMANQQKTYDAHCEYRGQRAQNNSCSTGLGLIPVALLGYARLNSGPLRLNSGPLPLA